MLREIVHFDPPATFQNSDPIERIQVAKVCISHWHRIVIGSLILLKYIFNDFEHILKHMCVFCMICCEFPLFLGYVKDAERNLESACLSFAA